MKFSSTEEKVIYEKLISGRDKVNMSSSGKRANIDMGRYNAAFSKISNSISELRSNMYCSALRPISSRRRLLGPIVKIVKRVIRKLTAWLIEPVWQQQSAFNSTLVTAVTSMFETNGELLSEIVCLSRENAELKSKIEAHGSKIETHEGWLKEHRIDLDTYRDNLKEIRRINGAIAREAIRAKWGLTDHLISHADNSGDEIECGICGYKNVMSSFETKETDCIFEGGHLVRYICPECGVIFGPVKFSKQLKYDNDFRPLYAGRVINRFDDDYVVHYTGFSEGDSTDKEILAFRQLKPEKGKVYLNYGCGSWSHSLQKLSEDGYTVHGYEPYSTDTGHPQMITDKETLSTMKFDGIFSNDLLEHLPDPVSELIFMKSLLRNSEARMSHSTACYAYMYEHTRFHMYFFTGRSLDVMCRRAGLKHSELIRDEKINDFLCYVFSESECEQSDEHSI